jgi:hypothetical protein
MRDASSGTNGPYNVCTINHRSIKSIIDHYRSIISHTNVITSVVGANYFFAIKVDYLGKQTDEKFIGTSTWGRRSIPSRRQCEVPCRRRFLIAAMSPPPDYPGTRLPFPGHGGLATSDTSTSKDFRSSRRCPAARLSSLALLQQRATLRLAKTRVRARARARECVRVSV